MVLQVIARWTTYYRKSKYKVQLGIPSTELHHLQVNISIIVKFSHVAFMGLNVDNFYGRGTRNEVSPFFPIVTYTVIIAVVNVCGRFVHGLLRSVTTVNVTQKAAN